MRTDTVDRIMTVNGGRRTAQHERRPSSEAVHWTPQVLQVTYACIPQVAKNIHPTCNAASVCVGFFVFENVSRSRRYG